MTKQTIHKHMCRLMVHKLGAFGSICLFHWRKDGKEKLIATLPVLTCMRRYLWYKWRDAVGTQQ